MVGEAILLLFHFDLLLSSGEGDPASSNVRTAKVNIIEEGALFLPCRPSLHPGDVHRDVLTIGFKTLTQLFLEAGADSLQLLFADPDELLEMLEL